jgi:hypothetical protein
MTVVLLQGGVLQMLLHIEMTIVSVSPQVMPPTHLAQHPPQATRMGTAEVQRQRQYPAQQQRLE